MSVYLEFFVDPHDRTARPTVFPHFFASSSQGLPDHFFKGGLLATIADRKPGRANTPAFQRHEILLHQAIF
jgi:hypothetical protein